MTTAAASSKPEEQPESHGWFHVSGTHVTEVSKDKVLRAQTYMLFEFERIVCRVYCPRIARTSPWAVIATLFVDRP